MFTYLVAMLIRKVFHSYSLHCMHRKLTIFAGRRTRIHSHNSEENKLLQPEILLSEENKQRSLECMQKASAIGLKAPNTTQGNTFAAVLICLCVDEKNEVSILYTRRSGLLTRHVRQISFPGGIKDPDDVDFIDCALRETEEEIGLHRKRINVWGTGRLIIPQHTAAIMPVIASVDGFKLEELNLNKDEVEEAFLVDIKDLIHPNTLRHTQFKCGWSTPNFVVGRNRIWGITAFITNTFLRCLIPTNLSRLKYHIKYVRPFKHKH